MKSARDLGKYIKQQSEDKGATAEELGQLLGWSKADVWQVYAGHKPLSFTQLSVLAKRFGVSVAHMLKDD